jgi:hypothetical protein
MQKSDSLPKTAGPIHGVWMGTGVGAEFQGLQSPWWLPEASSGSKSLVAGISIRGQHVAFGNQSLLVKLV